MKKQLLMSTALSLLLATAAIAQSANPSHDRSGDGQRGASPSMNNSAGPSNSGSDREQPRSRTDNGSGSGGATGRDQAGNTTPNGTDSKASTTNAGSAQNNRDNANRENEGAQNNRASDNAASRDRTTGENAGNQNQNRNTDNARTQSGTASDDRANTPDNRAQGTRRGDSSTAPNTNDATADQRGPGGESSRTANSRDDVNINAQQRTRISQSISRLNVRPVDHVNFSLAVGTSVPRDVRLEVLPADVVDVVPEYRGYSFFAARDEIVIVDPSSTKIVAVLPRSGSNAASVEPAHKRKVTISDRDREVIRKSARARTERTTVGSAAGARVHVGDRIPDSVTIESFPDEVYRDAPDLRDYRYLDRENRTYLIAPEDRTVIEEID